MLRGISSALHVLHEKGILHLDIKPENILFETKEKNAKAVLTDFGVAQVTNPELSSFQEVVKIRPNKTVAQMIHDLQVAKRQIDQTLLVGTVGYMAPEIVLGGSFTPKADVYSTGVVLYSLLTGKSPFPQRVSFF